MYSNWLQLALARLSLRKGPKYQVPALSDNADSRSMIYEHLRSIQPPSVNVGVACIYCDYQQQHVQTPSNLLASLWSQLYPCRDGYPPPYMENLYRAQVHQRTKPDRDQVQFVIQRAINELEKVYILVDGLDEVADMDRQEDFLGAIKTLLADSNVEGGKLHVLVTSRRPNHLFGGDSIEIRPVLEEITSMVERRIKIPRSFRHSIRDEVLNNPEIRSQILRKVASEANGIF